MKKKIYVILVILLVSCFICGCKQNNGDYEIGANIANEISPDDVLFSVGEWKGISQSTTIPLSVGEYKEELENGEYVSVVYYYNKMETYTESFLTISETKYDSPVSNIPQYSSTIVYFDNKDYYDLYKNNSEMIPDWQKEKMKVSFDEENLTMKQEVSKEYFDLLYSIYSGTTDISYGMLLDSIKNQQLLLEQTYKDVSFKCYTNNNKTEYKMVMEYTQYGQKCNSITIYSKM